MTLPKLTPEEKQKALQKAQEMRTRRANIRKKLKGGELTLAEVLANDADEAIARMRVAYLLESLPKILTKVDVFKALVKGNEHYWNG